ncbi:MAG TPA: hypothetical protein VJW20_15045 [Candidatus Angelobacter sp.]|nr:hypothetical protein [Candidatus Angelobacter sp.]
MVGPLNLLFHLMAAVIPGMAFLFLLWLHGTINLSPIFGRQMFGYKTMLCLALILSYVVGKLLVTPAITFALQEGRPVRSEKSKIPSSNKPERRAHRTMV